MTWTKYLVTTAFLVLGVGAYVPDAEAITAISACTAITTSGSYILTRNLVAAGNCLVVTADFVTTDLAGHTISGNGTGGGITTGSDVGITVRGGFVTNFFNGIDLISARDAIVERVPSIANTNFGIGVSEAAIIKDCVAANNGNTGISVGSRSLVTTKVSRQNMNGIVTALGSTVSGNVVGLNSNNGISAGIGSTVLNNTSRNNGNFGISAGCPSLVLGNTTTANGTNFSPDPAFPVGCVVDHNVIGP